MLFRVHTSMSLDGFSAGPDGWPVIAHMPDFEHGVSYGYDEITRTCSAVVVGRTTFDSAVSSPEWPWPGKRVYVLTSGQVTAPEGTDVVACHSPEEVVKSARDSDLPGDVQVLGGPSAIRAMCGTGAVDRLEIIVLPVLRGSGTPLVPFGISERRLRLDERYEYADGTVKLCYSIT